MSLKADTAADSTAGTSAFAVIRIGGPNPARVMDFLQGQLTCDLAQCSPEQAMRGAFCSRAGRVVADAVFLPPADANADADADWRMLILHEILPALTELTSPYARLARIRLEPDTRSLCTAFWRPEPTDYLRTDTDRDGLHINLNPLGRQSARADADTGANTGADTGAWGLSVCPRSPNTPPNTRQHQPSTENALLRRALQAGAAFLRLPMSGELTPHELNYPAVGMVHFDKGCYLGQEVVARMHHLGRLKKHFCAMRLVGEGPFAAGERLTTASGNALRLVDAYKDDGGWILGACVPDKELQAGHLPLADGSSAQIL